MHQAVQTNKERNGCQKDWGNWKAIMAILRFFFVWLGLFFAYCFTEIIVAHKFVECF